MTNIRAFKGLDESELCIKIQKLMNSLKNNYDNDKVKCFRNKSPNIVQNKESILLSVNKNASNNEMYSDTESFFSLSEDYNRISDLSSCDEFPYSNAVISQINANNGKPCLKSNTTKLACNTLNFRKVQCANFIPERTLSKIQTLENLIKMTDRNLRNTEKNEFIRTKLTKLIEEFQKVKTKIEIGTKHKLVDNEIMELMETLKLLFDQFYSIQRELNSLKLNDLQIVQNNKSAVATVEYPMKPPRGIGKTAISGGKRCISDVSINSEDILSMASREKQMQCNELTNVYHYDASLQNEQKQSENCHQLINTSVLDIIQLKQKYFQSNYNESLHDSTKNGNAAPKNLIFNDCENNFFNLYKFEMSKSMSSLKLPTNSKFLEPPTNIKAIENGIFESNKNLSDIESEDFKHFCDKLKPKSRKLTNDGFSYSKSNFVLNKASKLPVLRKEIPPDIPLIKSGKISCLSQTIADKVTDNLQQLGYYSKLRTRMEPICHFRSRSEGTTKSATHKIRQKDTTSSLIKEEDRLFKSCASSLYLTKLGSSRQSKISKSDFASGKRCRSSTSRIFSLESLLQKNKYRFVDENRLSNGSKSSSHEKSFFQSINSLYFANGDSKEIKKEDNETDLAMLLSLGGNSIKIVHQIILFPTKALEVSSSDNLAKNPRLVHIENICSCKIIILKRKEYLKQKIRPCKELKVIEIHYDLRKGKALGCINMLRQLAGPLTQCMKIYRSSVLLPGGYLKEMSSCSITELMNLSYQSNENVKFYRSKETSKLNVKPQKQRENISKTVSLNCLEIS